MKGYTSKSCLFRIYRWSSPPLTRG